MDYLKKFQKENRLYPDGAIGKNTLTKMMQVFGTNKEETAFFLGQIDVETGGFRYGEENLNYSAQGLLATFGKYFPTRELADQYARKPEKIANRVYANRGGNGDEASGDGWKHRGFGALQLTLKNNQERFAQKIKDLCIIDTPSIISSKYYFESALYYFNENDVWDNTKTVSTDNITRVSKHVNLGNPNSRYTPNHLKERIERTNYYYNKLKQL
jgi:putative chitinase